jgi:hypothetical protein
VAVTALDDTASVLALTSAQNTDPLLALSAAVEPAHELLITPAEAVATVLPSITPVEEVSTLLVIATAEEAATALTLVHVEVAATLLAVTHMETVAAALVIVICLPGHCRRCHVLAKVSMCTVGSTALWGFYPSKKCCLPIHGAQFPNPATGQFFFSTNTTVSDSFMSFKELVRLVSNPGFVRVFQNLVVLVLVNQSVCKCFNSSWNIWTIHSYRPRLWFADQYSGGSAEFSDYDFDNLRLLPSQLFNSSNLTVSAGVTLHAEFFCSPLIFQPGLSGIIFVDLCSLLGQAVYCVDAQDHLGSVLSCMIHVKPTAYCFVVLNSLFPLARESMFIPKTDQQAQKQPHASYLNTDTELFLARHCELHAYDDIDCPSSSVQMLDTKWLFDCNKNSSFHMIDHFSTRIVTNSQPQILGFDCYDVHVLMNSMLEIKLYLGICAYCDIKLFQMDTTTAFISAAFQPGELIYCNPPHGVDLGLVSNGLPSVWKLQAPLESTCTAAMCWTQSSSIPVQSFGFVSIGSGGAFWMHHHPLDDMLLCTYVNDFLLAASSLCLAQRSHHHYSLHYDCNFFC